MLEKSDKPVPLNAPAVAVRALATAEENLRPVHDNSLPMAAAQISGAASLLMIAELLEETLKELRQLRGILCARRGL